MERRTLFDKDGDFLAFERVMEETLRTCKMRICAYCLMSNHGHFVVRPESDGDPPTFMQQLTNMRVKRWKEHRREVGLGHLYQGRFKSFPVQKLSCRDRRLFHQVVRYVEWNALRANMVARAEDWPWSSLRRGERDDPTAPLLAALPVARPANWLEIVNQSQTEGDLEALRRSLQRGAPYGGTTWARPTLTKLQSG